MTRPVVKPLFVFSGLVCFIAAVLWLAPGGLELRVTAVRSGRPMLILPMQPGERFTIHYYHSVENAPIWEEHSLDREGTIYIEEERYLKFGAGMGRMPGIGRMVQKGPYEAIENMHMKTGDFVLRIGSRDVRHTIIWREKRINLSNAAPHQAVRFSARPVSLMTRLWRALFPHETTPPSIHR